MPAGQRDRERDASRVGQQVVLGTCAGTVDRRRPRVEPPKSAPTWLPSITALDQSIRPAALSRRSSSRCSDAHAPARCHSCRRRCAVAGEQPSSRGRCRHAIPVKSTNTIAPKHTRSSTRGRPARGSGSCRRVCPPLPGLGGRSADRRLHPSSMRPLGRDRPPVPARRHRRLRVLPQSQPLLLGLPPARPVRRRWHPTRARVDLAQTRRTRHRHRTARSLPARRRRP